MFRVPDARVYDFSKWNPYIFGAVVVILCWFISMNTRFDQFLRVSQLPVDRDETNALKYFKINITGNRFDIYFGFKFIFSITRDQFLNDMVAIQRVGIFTVTFKRNNFGNLRYDENGNGQAEFLTPVYGNGSLRFTVLDTEIAHLNFDINIAWLYPGMSLASGKKLEYKLDNIAFANSCFITFFHCNVTMDDKALKFESGRTFPHTAKTENSKDFIKAHNECEKYNEKRLVLAEPSQNETPFKWLISVLNPIADAGNQSIALLLNEEETNPLRELLNFSFPNVTLISPKSCVFFERATVYARTSHYFGNSRQRFPRSPGDTVVFLVNDTTVDISSLGHKICSDCKSVTVDMSLGYAAAVESLSAASHIVSQYQEYLALAFLLPRGAHIYTINEEPEPWVKEMAVFLNQSVSTYFSDAFLKMM